MKVSVEKSTSKHSRTRKAKSLIEFYKHKILYLEKDLNSKKSELNLIKNENKILRKALSKYIEKDDSLKSMSQLSPSQSQHNVMTINEINELLDKSDELNLSFLSELSQQILSLEQQTDFNANNNYDIQNNEHEPVHVAISIIILSDQHPNCVLAREIKVNKKLSLPFTILQHGETWEQCAKRELKEQINTEIQGFIFVYVSNDYIVDENKHYITIFLQGIAPYTVDSDIENHYDWKWYEWISLYNRTDLSIPLQNLLKGYNPFIIENVMLNEC